GAPSGDRLARDSAGPRVSEGAPIASEKTPVAEERARSEQSSCGSDALSDATGYRGRRAHVGDPVERRFHAALQPSDSRDGRHGGCVTIDSEPGKYRSFRSRAAAVAGTALRR